MSNVLDNLIGRSFGLLKVVERAPNDQYDNVYWRCRCECGDERMVRAEQLRSGRFFTCGKAACRFWEKVYRPEGVDCCHEWTGAVRDDGYGVMKLPGAKKIVRVHVFAWELEHGPVPNGMFVLHRCDNRRCVRHLFLGDHASNMADMVSKGRQSTGARPRIPISVKERVRADWLLGVRTQAQLAVDNGLDLRTIGRIICGDSRIINKVIRQEN